MSTKFLKTLPYSDVTISLPIAQFLYKFTKQNKIKTAIEFGSGVSTIVLGTALKELGGKLYSIEEDENYVYYTQQWLIAHKLTDTVRLMFCKLRKYPEKAITWYSISNNFEPLQLIFVDGPKGSGNRWPCLEMIQKYIADNCYIIVDDFNREGERFMVEYWLRSFKNLKLHSTHQFDRDVCVLIWR